MHQHSHGELPADVHQLRRVGIVLVLTLGFVAIQLLVGFSAHSLAVLTDAAHNFTDAIGIGLVLSATWIVRRKSSEPSTSIHRWEVFSAIATALLMLIVAVWVMVEAVSRLGTPHHISAASVVVVGCLGLAVNFVAVLVVRRGDTSHVAVRGVYLEVLTDTLGSAGVLIAGSCAWAFHWYRADSIITIAIALFMVPRSVVLLRDSVRLLN